MSVQIEKIRQSLFSKFPYLAVSDFEQLFSQADLTVLKKGKIFIDLDKKSWKIGFILGGIIRGYHIKDGEEKTIFFASSEEVVASYNTIIFKEASTVVYQAIVETFLITFDWNKMQKLYRDNSNLERMSKDMILSNLGKSIKRLEAQVMFSPEERYVDFLKNYHHLLNDIPQKYIASFIGVTPVSLSRIRKRMMKK